MPKPDGTLYRWERAELNCAQTRYEAAVRRSKIHAHSSSRPIYEASEKTAFADLMRITTKYAGCK